VLLDRAIKDYPHLFTADRLWILDRNFPAVPASPGCWAPARTC
jgi:hypothetical protein